MNEHEFTLEFQLPDSQSDPEQYLDALYEAGCDDASVGIGRSGFIALHFIREAESAQAAIESAISDVQQAIPGVTLQ